MNAIIRRMKKDLVGYTCREAMEKIRQESGVKLHPAHVWRIMKSSGFSLKAPQKMFVNRATKEERKKFQRSMKRYRTIAIRDGKSLWVEDEGILEADAIIAKKRMTAEGVRPHIAVNGDHEKTVVYGARSMDGRQCFKQYDKFNAANFVDHLNECWKRGNCEPMIMVVDGAPQHKANIVKEYLKAHPNITLKFLPKGTPEFNAIEECWRQLKRALLRSEYQSSLPELKRKVAKYLRTKRFKLDIMAYFLRELVV